MGNFQAHFKNNKEFKLFEVNVWQLLALGNSPLQNMKDGYEGGKGADVFPAPFWKEEK